MKYLCYKYIASTKNKCFSLILRFLDLSQVYLLICLFNIKTTPYVNYVKKINCQIIITGHHIKTTPYVNYVKKINCQIIITGPTVL